VVVDLQRGAAFPEGAPGSPFPSSSRSESDRSSKAPSQRHGRFKLEQNLQSVCDVRLCLTLKKALVTALPRLVACPTTNLA